MLVTISTVPPTTREVLTAEDLMGVAVLVGDPVCTRAANRIIGLTVENGTPTLVQQEVFGATALQFAGVSRVLAL